jgi:flagellar biosynthesis/type III secretory pathway M-ring protein FliF/YscJ
MAFTDINLSQAGVVYDTNENLRLNDYANQFNKITENQDVLASKNNDAIRYAIIVGGAVLLIVLLGIIVKKKK